MAGERPDSDGELTLYCPVHDDYQASCTVNVKRGVWYCHAGCGGGSVRQLVDNRDGWVPAEGRVSRGGARPSNGRNGGGRVEEITEAKVAGWHQALLANAKARADLFDARGISIDTIEKFELGWDSGRNVYTIPIRGPKGRIWNVRRYDLAPSDDRRKIWSVKGMGAKRLFPYATARRLEPGDHVILAEGEWDAMLTAQHDFKVVTQTGGAGKWDPAWNKYFTGCVVYLAHDCDETGMDANALVYDNLKDIAESVRLLRLPYPIVEKHGKDLTDFWLDYHEHGSTELQALMDDAQPWNPDRHEDTEALDPEDANVMDSFDSRKVGQTLRLTVTIKGKREPGYSVPREATYSCKMDAGAKCQICPMMAKGGADRVEIESGDPVLLEMVDCSKTNLIDTLRTHNGIPKCNRVGIDVEKYQAVEVLYARPSVDHVRKEGHDDYKNMKVMSAGRHDTRPNNTVQVTGALYPNPRSQANEFLAWDVQKMATSLDTFVLDGEAIQQMRRFQPVRGERPLKKLGAISRSLAAHVTKIYGRPELHAAMDLVYHSALAFTFAGDYIERGWLELLVVGDTRTGKSEVASKLARHYSAGEVISCEAATFAGIVGGLQQYGSNKEWAVTWGAIPINDRRLVVLDEVGGLHPEEIARMSAVRSSGTAELTKIQSERTFARTRLIWLGNPRNGRMSDFTYGVQAIRPLIGNAEDIARFDFAMAVVSTDVPAEMINERHRAGRVLYTPEACSALVRWVWSRKPDQIVFTREAEDETLRLSLKMGKRYVESPPLVQSANLRVKIARLAVALAGRLFSTDDEAETIIVRPEHVQDAVQFLERVYWMRSFGYGERSAEILADRRTAADESMRVERWLEERPNLIHFLKSTGSFRRGDLEEILDIDRASANAIINTLWEARMIRKDRGDIKVEPPLHDILREAN